MNTTKEILSISESDYKEKLQEMSDEELIELFRLQSKITKSFRKQGGPPLTNIVHKQKLLAQEQRFRKRPDYKKFSLRYSLKKLVQNESNHQTIENKSMLPKANTKNQLNSVKNNDNLPEWCVPGEEYFWEDGYPQRQITSKEIRTIFGQCEVIVHKTTK